MDNVRLVIADIDGTLADYRQRHITEKTKEVIAKLRQQGIYFGLASGRALNMELDDYYKLWGFDKQFDVLVGANGCELYDGIHDRVYSEYNLKTEYIQEIYEMMDVFGVDSTIYVGDLALCYTTDQEMINFFNKNYKERKFRIAKDLSEMWQQENNKIMFRVEDENIPEIIEYFDKHGDSKKYHYVRTAPGTLEFHHPDASKGVALLEFCKLNDLSINSVVAFGDADNDLSMIEAAGTGVCMLNGTELMKEAADIITDKGCNEDGFADFVEKYILN